MGFIFTHQESCARRCRESTRALWPSAPTIHAPGKSGAPRRARGWLRVSLDDQFGAIVSRLDIEQGLPSQRVFAVRLNARATAAEQRDHGNQSRRGALSSRVTATPTVLPARVISQRIHQQSELASRIATRLSAEQLAAGCDGDQQPHFSRAVSVCVRAVRQLRERLSARSSRTIRSLRWSS